MPYPEFEKHGRIKLNSRPPRDSSDYVQNDEINKKPESPQVMPSLTSEMIGWMPDEPDKVSIRPIYFADVQKSLYELFSVSLHDVLATTFHLTALHLNEFDWDIITPLNNFSDSNCVLFTGYPGVAPERNEPRIPPASVVIYAEFSRRYSMVSITGVNTDRTPRIVSVQYDGLPGENPNLSAIAVSLMDEEFKLQSTDELTPKQMSAYIDRRTKNTTKIEPNCINPSFHGIVTDVMVESVNRSQERSHTEMLIAYDRQRTPVLFNTLRELLKIEHDLDDLEYRNNLSFTEMQRRISLRTQRDRLMKVITKKPNVRVSPSDTLPVGSPIPFFIQDDPWGIIGVEPEGKYRDRLGDNPTFSVSVPMTLSA